MGLKEINPSLVSKGFDEWGSHSLTAQSVPSENQAQFTNHRFDARNQDPNRHFRCRPAYRYTCYNGKCLSSVRFPTPL